MRKYMRWIILGGLIAAVVVLRAVASSSEAETMTPRASGEWSRGRVIGYTPVKQPVDLQPAPGGGAFLVWPNLDGRLELAHIGVDGEVLLDRVLPVEMRRARDPQLEVGPEGRLHLLWREQEGPHTGVRHVLLDADGVPVRQPQALSDPQRTSGALGALQLARDAAGCLYALWADDAGIHWATLDGEGEMMEGPTLVVPEGHSPLARMDDHGRLHLVWRQEVRLNVSGVYYAVLGPEKGEPSEPEKIAEIVLNDRLRLEDVAFGLSQDTGHVFWSEYDEGFDRYLFMHAFFPLDAPQQAQVDLWHLKMGDGPLAISLPEGQQTPLPVALSERGIGLGQGLERTSGDELGHYLISNESAVASGQELKLQITLLTLGMGAEQGDTVEQVVTASSRASIKPVLAIDGRSHLHLAWLETGGFGQYRLIYASTAPGVLEEYNALTFWDVLNMAFSKLFRLSLLVVTVVLTFITWAIIPLLGLVGYHLVTHEEMLDTMRPRVALVAVLAVEVVLTFALPPRMTGMEVALPVLRWGIPSVAAVAAAAVTAGVARRRGDVHLFAAFFLFAILNNLLQIALYLLF
jgi:hypothetical protein